MPGPKIDLPSGPGSLTLHVLQSRLGSEAGLPGLRKDRCDVAQPMGTATRCLYSILVPLWGGRACMLPSFRGETKAQMETWGEATVANSRGSRLKLVWWALDWVLIWWVTLDKSQRISGPLWQSRWKIISTLLYLSHQKALEDTFVQRDAGSFP